MRGLYNGVAPAAVRSSVGMAIWLAARNHLERVLPDDSAAWRASRHFLSGALASVAVDVVTFPLDTLKKNLQAAPGGSRAGVAREAARLLEGGVARFYRGYVARLALVSLNGALFNAILVSTKRVLGPIFDVNSR